MGSGAVMRQFQLEGNTQKKLDKTYGMSLMKYIETTMGAGIGNNYYWPRNTRFKINRDWAAGKMDIQAMFADRMRFNGKFNYLNIKWAAPMIVNRIISGLVGRWMQRDERIVVTATDPISTQDKQKNYETAEFQLFNKQKVSQLQQASGLNLVPPDQFVPQDQTELDLWVQEGQHIPEEIANEKAINDIYEYEGLYGPMKKKLLHDGSETGFVGLYTWMDEDGVVHEEWVKSENAIYSFSEYDDLRDCTWKGRVRALKIREARVKFGPGTKRNLTEEQLWELAQTTQDYQLSDKLRWTAEWTISLLRPYDEWNLDIIDVEIKSEDTDMYLVTETRKHKSTLIEKNPGEVTISDNQALRKKTKTNIYHGIYARKAGVLLEWELLPNMIIKNGKEDSGEADFSYSFFIYQSINMRNLAIPEKIEEPVQAMIFTVLRMQQLMAKVRPIGAAVNKTALLQVFMGKAKDGTLLDAKDFYDQTGDLYYNGKDAEGNPIPIPINELRNDGFTNQMDAYIKAYEFHYGRLKDELGEDPNLIMAATQPRVAAENVQASMAQGSAATNHIYDAYLYVMEDAAAKTACLLRNSVKFGASAYRQLLNEKDFKDRSYSTKIRMLPDDAEKAAFRNYMMQILSNNQEFILYIDPWKLERVAEQDVKLAEKMFLLAQRKAIQAQAQQAQQNSQMTAQVQIQSAQAKSQSDMALEDQKHNNAMALKQLEWQQSKEQKLIDMFTAMYTKNGAVPPEWKGVEKEMVENVGMPVFAKNIGNQIALSQGLSALQDQSENQNPQNINPQQSLPPSPQSPQQAPMPGQVAA